MQRNSNLRHLGAWLRHLAGISFDKLIGRSVCDDYEDDAYISQERHPLSHVLIFDIIE
ncbi:MAG: hypothetical protein ACK5PB_09510 [Pirellula sp.]